MNNVTMIITAPKTCMILVVKKICLVCDTLYSTDIIPHDKIMIIYIMEEQRVNGKPKLKSDIDIALSVKLKPITEIAESVGMSEDDLELYGKYKAKL